MSIQVLKAEMVLAAVLGALRREIVLPGLIWLDPSRNFVGAKNDTLNLTIPAATSARRRGLRSGDTRNRDSLAEGKVAVTLSTNLYKDVEITDAELTLDIKDFGAQVLSPIASAMVEGWEEEVADLMHGATYDHTVAWDGDDPHSVLVDAGVLLDKSKVPQAGRFCVLGTNLAADATKSDQLRRADSAGAAAATALAEAQIPAVGGFSRVYKSQALDPDVGYAFHRTAYAGASKVPVVPGGVSWGQSMTHEGFAMRVIRDFDSSAEGWVDILGFDAFVGTNVVQDHGAFDGRGRWVPAATPDNDDGEDLHLIRAVQIGAVGGS